MHCMRTQYYVWLYLTNQGTLSGFPLSIIFLFFLSFTVSSHTYTQTYIHTHIHTNTYKSVDSTLTKPDKVNNSNHMRIINVCSMLQIKNVIEGWLSMCRVISEVYLSSDCTFMVLFLGKVFSSIVTIFFKTSFFTQLG